LALYDLNRAWPSRGDEIEIRLFVDGKRACMYAEPASIAREKDRGRVRFSPSPGHHVVPPIFSIFYLRAICRQDLEEFSSNPSHLAGAYLPWGKLEENEAFMFRHPD